MSILPGLEGCLVSRRLKLKHFSYDALLSHRTSPLTKTKRVKCVNAELSSSRTLLRDVVTQSAAALPRLFSLRRKAMAILLVEFQMSGHPGGGVEGLMSSAYRYK